MERSGARAFGAVLCAVGAAALVAPPATAQHFPPIQPGPLSVRLHRVATGLAGDVGGEPQISPTDVAAFGDGSGRLAVATLGGVVRVIDGAGNLLPDPLLTQAQTRSQSPAGAEWGLLSVAFDPGFGSPGMPGHGAFYTITARAGDDGGTVPDFGVTAFQNHQDMVTEWRLADPSRSVFSPAMGDTKRELFRVGQPGQPHNLTDLAFGPDGMLYVGSGDGGLIAENSQDPREILGAILRIDPFGSDGRTGEYGIPADNPFVGGETVTLYTTSNPLGEEIDPLDEVFAYGFRNPFRIGFDRLTGDLYAGEVGQSDVEEIDRVEAGRNYGWNIKEGSLKSGQSLGAARVEPDTVENNPWSDTQTLAEQFGLTDPILEYDHDEGVTVIGGFVYRGSQIPALQGKYVFADFGVSTPTARLFYGDPDAGEVLELQIAPGGDLFGEGDPLPQFILGIGEDEDGELLLAVVAVDPREGGGSDGEIVLVPEPGAVLLLAVGAAVLRAAGRRARRAP